MYAPRILLTVRRLTITRGVDFDDPDYGFKEEDKDEGKVSFLLSALLLSKLIGC
jgi:hypothetical protein